MYRVYDKKKERWVKDGIYLTPNEDLSTSTKALFGTEKLSLASNQRYVLQKSIGLKDMRKVSIFEGDIASVTICNENEELIVIGVVAYYPDHASYYLFDYQNAKYYPINSEICKHLEIIGNVIDNSNLLPS